jgi:glucose dehydrogenase
VVVAAGGHWGSPTPPGDHLMAFALPKEVFK